MAATIDPVNLQALAIAMGDAPVPESPEIIAPFRANADAFAAVSRITYVIRIFDSLNDSRPYSVKRLLVCQTSKASFAANAATRE